MTLTPIFDQFPRGLAFWGSLGLQFPQEFHRSCSTPPRRLTAMTTRTSLDQHHCNELELHLNRPIERRALSRVVAGEVRFARVGQQRGRGKLPFDRSTPRQTFLFSHSKKFKRRFTLVDLQWTQWWTQRRHSPMQQRRCSRTCLWQIEN